MVIKVALRLDNFNNANKNNQMYIGSWTGIFKELFKNTQYIDSDLRNADFII